jgi:hypothetical protein
LILRRRIATAVGVAVGAAAYLLTLLDYGTSWTRTAMGLGYASNFFDLQARAFMDGHIWVPPGSLGIEGFVVRGHEYMYFPPFPALLRLPVLFTTSEFDGRLTLVSMALAFVVMAVMTSRLLWLVRDLLVPGTEVTRTEAASLAILLALCLGGTTLTFDASDPWVYHEVYAWAIPLVVGSMYWMLRVLREPTPAAIGWLLAFDAATILTRTTGGWAVCGVTMVLGVWLLTGRANPDVRRSRGAWVLAAGALALAVGIAYNWVKFRHPYLFPLEDQAWTRLNAHRRAALAANGGTITGPQFLPTTLSAYFRPDGIRFTDYFPWITLPAHPAQPVGDVVIDQTYRTGSVTAFMPWLLLLTVLSVPMLFRPRLPLARRWLRAPLIAGVLLTGGVMGYGYLAMRYTSEFVPALILGAMVSTVLLTRLLVRRPVLLGALLVPVAVLAALGIAAQMLTGYAEAAYTSRGPTLERYLTQQHDRSPTQQAALIRHFTGSVDDLPADHTDTIAIQGDCDAIYLDTGDDSQPWVPVVSRGLVFDLTLDVDRLRAVSVRLARIPRAGPGGRPGFLWLLTNNQKQARLIIDAEGLTRGTDWFDVLRPGQLRVGLRDVPELGYAEVTATPGGHVGWLRSFVYDARGVGHPVRFTPVPHRTGLFLDRHGIELTRPPGLTPSLCTTLGQS